MSPCLAAPEVPAYDPSAGLSADQLYGGKPIEVVRRIRDDIGRLVHALLADELVPATSEA